MKKEDKVVSVFINKSDDVVITSSKYLLWFDMNEVNPTGIRSGGVRGINLVKDDYVVSGFNVYDDTTNLIIFTDKKSAKRVKLNEFDKITRYKRGTLLLREVKSNPYNVIKVFSETNKDEIGLVVGNDTNHIISTEIPILDRYSTGSNISKHVFEDVFVNIDLSKREEEKTEIDIKDIDDKLLTIEDFLK